MSQILSDVTLTLNTTSPVSLSGYPPVNIYWIAFINTSPFALRATAGSNTVNIPAWYYYPVFVGGRLTGNISVTPTAQTIPGFNFQSTLSTTLYSEYERPVIPVPQPLGGSPVGMTASGTALAVDNEGNPAGTVFITGKVLGDAQAAVVATVDGIVAIGDATNPGSLSVVGPITATGNIQGDSTNNLNFDSKGKAGVFKVSGVQEGFWDANGFTFNNDLHFPAGVGLATNNDLLMKGGVVKANTSQDMNIDTTTGANKINLKSAGTLIADVNSGGLTLDSGTFSFLLGSISKIAKFTGTATTVATFFNHNLGVIPDVVLIQLNGLSSTAHSITADYASMTTTQVKLQADGNNAFVGLAIKF